MITIDDVRYLAIPKTIIEAYDARIRLVSSYKGARESLNAFIEYVNGLQEISKLTDKEVRELFLLYTPARRNMSMKILRRNAKGLAASFKLITPSALKFSELDHEGEKILACQTMSFGKTKGTEPEPVMLSYWRGKWRLTI